MQVILLQKVANLGGVGDQVNVRPGFGRNFLIPQEMAVAATPSNIEAFEARRAELEKAAEAVLAAAKAREAELQKLSIVIEAKAGDEGKLFGSIGPRDVANAVTAAGVEVAKKEIDLPAGPIRHTGEFEVNVRLHSDVVAGIQITVAPLA